MANQDFRLQQRLRNHAKKRIVRLGLGMTSSSHTLMERMIDNGIERMAGQGVSDREEQIWFAEQSLSRYLGKLCAKAQSTGAFPVVDEKLFERVLKEQCPLWPYC